MKPIIRIHGLGSNRRSKKKDAKKKNILLILLETRMDYAK
jgi:hypothetical protein